MQARSATGATAAATQSQPEPQDVALPGGGRLPLMGFGTYKVESSAAVTCALRPLSALSANCAYCHRTLSTFQYYHLCILSQY